MLAYATAAIDTIQTAKSQILNTVVPNDTFKKPLQSLIDAQTEFAKAAAKVSYDLYDAVTKLDFSDFVKKTK